MLLKLLVSAASGTSASAGSFFVWHITDVHVDPWYVPNADASSCYCETAASCPRIGAHCAVGANKTTSALPWGNSEGNCGEQRHAEPLVPKPSPPAPKS